MREFFVANTGRPMHPGSKSDQGIPRRVKSGQELQSLSDQGAGLLVRDLRAGVAARIRALRELSPECVQFLACGLENPDPLFQSAGNYPQIRGGHRSDTAPKTRGKPRAAGKTRCQSWFAAVLDRARTGGGNCSATAGIRVRLVQQGFPGTLCPVPTCGTSSVQSGGLWMRQGRLGALTPRPSGPGPSAVLLLNVTSPLFPRTTEYGRRHLDASLVGHPLAYPILRQTG